VGAPGLRRTPPPTPARAAPPPPPPPVRPARGGARPVSAAAAAAAVSRSCACIGSPCLRHCVHGAPVGGGGVNLSNHSGAAGACVYRPAAESRPEACRVSGTALCEGAGRSQALCLSYGAACVHIAGVAAAVSLSFLRVHWVAVPEAMRARRVNRRSPASRPQRWAPARGRRRWGSCRSRRPTSCRAWVWGWVPRSALGPARSSSSWRWAGSPPVWCVQSGLLDESPWLQFTSECQRF
jgi:hypothetical protein